MCTVALSETASALLTLLRGAPVGTARLCRSTGVSGTGRGTRIGTGFAAASLRHRHRLRCGVTTASVPASAPTKHECRMPSAHRPYVASRTRRILQFAAIRAGKDGAGRNKTRRAQAQGAARRCDWSGEVGKVGKLSGGVLTPANYTESSHRRPKSGNLREIAGVSHGRVRKPLAETGPAARREDPDGAGREA